MKQVLCVRMHRSKPDIVLPPPSAVKVHVKRFKDAMAGKGCGIGTHCQAETGFMPCAVLSDCFYS